MRSINSRQEIMLRSPFTRVAIFFLDMSLFCSVLDAGTIVIANRTGNKVSFQYTDAEARPQTIVLPGGEIVSLVNKHGASVNFNGGEGPKELPLSADSAYCFIDA